MDNLHEARGKGSCFSARICAEAERAALLVRASFLEKKHALEQQEEELRRQAERLRRQIELQEIEVQIAATNYKLTVLKSSKRNKTCSHKSKSVSKNCTLSQSQINSVAPEQTGAGIDKTLNTLAESTSQTNGALIIQQDAPLSETGSQKTSESSLLDMADIFSCTTTENNATGCEEPLEQKDSGGIRPSTEEALLEWASNDAPQKEGKPGKTGFPISDGQGTTVEMEEKLCNIEQSVKASKENVVGFGMMDMFQTVDLIDDCVFCVMHVEKTCSIFYVKPWRVYKRKRWK